MPGSETNLETVGKVSTKGNKGSKESIRRGFVCYKEGHIAWSCPFNNNKNVAILLPVWRGMLPSA